MRTQDRINSKHSTGYGSLSSKDVENGSTNAVPNEDIGKDEQHHATSKASFYATNAVYALCFTVLLLLSIFPSDFFGSGRTMSKKVTPTVIKPFHETVSEIPYDHVDRSDYSLPANQVINPSLFHQSLRNDVECDSNNENCTPKEDTYGKSLLKVPMPTGAFWTNLVIPYVTGDGTSFPIVAYPYAFKWSDDTFLMSYSSLRRIMDELSIRDIFNADVTFKTSEPIQSRYVTKFDPLSVTLRFNGNSDRNIDALDPSKFPYWETYLVQGSPWMTGQYVGMTPIIHALSIFKGVDCPPGSDCQVVLVPWKKLTTGSEPYKLKGTKFLIHTQQGVTCLLVTSKTVTIEFDMIRKTTVKFSEPFDGVLRYAFVPPYQSNDFSITNAFLRDFKPVDVSNSTGFKALMDSSNIYPVGGNVKWRFEDSSPSPSSSDKQSLGKIQFQYETKSMLNDPSTKASSECSDDLLMLSLPHHTQILKKKNLMNTTDFDLYFRTIKGYMTPVIGSCWEMEEQLSDTGFGTSSSLERAQNLNATVRETILKNIETDMNQLLPSLNENVYGYGKQLARLAQLTLIGHNLKQGKDMDAMLGSLLKSLHTYVVDYLTGNIKDKLVYDSNLGGMISIDGLKNSGGDFGNGWYNDHHFHYGYILYACGVLGKFNSTFVKEYGTNVDAIMYDVAFGENSNSNDAVVSPSFPFTRHKSWFDGHSFASGLFAFADAKSQESSTESINCYYGAYLWSSVREDSNEDVTNFARLLLATEIRSVKLYWHMNANGLGNALQNDASIYNPIFAKNLMVGNAAMTDVTVTTWFGNEQLYVHLINFMPITAITREVFDKAYIENEFNEVMKPIYDNIEAAWKGYAVADRAMIEPIAAWNDAQQIQSKRLDQAISLSQILYFIATMEDFASYDSNSDSNSDSISDQSISLAPVPTNAPTGSTDNKIFCAANWKCANQGLSGSCCPTAQGVVLSCCNL